MGYEISNSAIDSPQVELGKGIPLESTSENRVIRVVECIRNDTGLSDSVFTRDVYELIRDGSEDKALEIIRKIIPTAAEKLGLRLSSEETQMAAAIILVRARKVQKFGEWNKVA